MNRILSIELRAIVRAILFSLLLGLIAATVVYFSSLSEELLPALGKGILILSVFLAACQVSRHHGSKGLIRGLSIGVFFFIIMLIATIIFDSSLLTLKTISYTLLLCLLAGGAGGIMGIGINGN